MLAFYHKQTLILKRLTFQLFSWIWTWNCSVQPPHGVTLATLMKVQPRNKEIKENFYVFWQWKVCMFSDYVKSGHLFNPSQQNAGSIFFAASKLKICHHHSSTIPWPQRCEMSKAELYYQTVKVKRKAFKVQDPLFDWQAIRRYFCGVLSCDHPTCQQ